MFVSEGSCAALAGTMAGGSVRQRYHRQPPMVRRNMRATRYHPDAA
jgi:hypothetical protein